MGPLTIEQCPETKVCSIVKPGAGKADLTPEEVQEIKNAGSNIGKVREIVAGANSDFAAQLATSELEQVMAKLG